MAKEDTSIPGFVDLPEVFALVEKMKGSGRSKRQISVDQMLDTIFAASQWAIEAENGIASMIDPNIIVHANLNALIQLGVTIEEIASAIEYSEFYDSAVATALRERGSIN